MGGPVYKDVANLGEDARIDMIGQKAMGGESVAFIVDSDPGKAERYIKKLLTKFPKLKILKKFPGPVKDTTAVTVGLMDEEAS